MFSSGRPAAEGLENEGLDLSLCHIVIFAVPIHLDFLRFESRSQRHGPSLRIVQVRVYDADIDEDAIAGVLVGDHEVSPRLVGVRGIGEKFVTFVTELNLFADLVRCTMCSSLMGDEGGDHITDCVMAFSDLSSSVVTMGAVGVDRHSSATGDVANCWGDRKAKVEPGIHEKVACQTTGSIRYRCKEKIAAKLVRGYH